MWDFKNKYFIDLLLLLLIILIGIMLSDEYSIKASIIGSLSILLCITFITISINIKSKLSNQKEIISNNKQKIYLAISILIIIGLLIFNIKLMFLALCLPISFSIATIINSILFKED
jgi:hypothetical protein